MSNSKRLLYLLLNCILTIGLLAACGQNQETQVRTDDPLKTVESYFEAGKNKDTEVAYSLLYNKDAVDFSEFKLSIESNNIVSYEVIDGKEYEDNSYKVLVHFYFEDIEEQQEAVFIMKKDGDSWLIDLNPDPNQENLEF